MTNLKQQVYNQCLEFINQRLEVVQRHVKDIQSALQSETKSSAGDKHETGRAMLQLEREKAGHQLSEIEKQNEILHKINTESKHQRVAFGSIVKTTHTNYFIAISAGEVTVNDTTYYAVSSATPIAQLMLSKQIGDKIIFRGNQFVIKDIQ